MDQLDLLVNLMTCLQFCFQHKIEQMSAFVAHTKQKHRKQK